jgi:hypothetical protein
MIVMMRGMVVIMVMMRQVNNINMVMVSSLRKDRNFIMINVTNFWIDYVCRRRSDICHMSVNSSVSNMMVMVSIVIMMAMMVLEIVTMM